MTVYDIGLDPGETDLVTIKGERLLESAAVVYSPGRLSRTVTLNRVPEERIDDLGFPMARDPDEFRRAWKETAAEVVTRADSENVAFVTLGDPNVCLVFDHLRRTLDAFHPEIDLEVVPDVGVMTIFMATLGVEIESETGLASCGTVNDAAPTDPDRMAPFKVTDTSATHEKLIEVGYGVRSGRRPLMEQDETVATDDPNELAERDYYTLVYTEREGVERDMATAEFDDIESGGSA